MLHNLLSGIRALFQRDRRNAEIQDELSSFLEASVAQKIRSGQSPSLHNLRSQPLGFNSTNVLVANTNPKFAGYQSSQLNALYQLILDRLSALPGVRSAAISGAPPMSRGNWGSPITIPGPTLTPSENIGVSLNRISPGYFETLSIPLLRGRTIGFEDTASSPRSVVVNQTFANFFFPKGDAIGHIINIGDPDAGVGWHIVGIVRDTKRSSPADQPKPFAWLAVMQLTGDDQFAYTLQIQTAGDPDKITSAVRSALVEIDPNLPFVNVSTLSESVDHLLDEQKFVSQLSGCFSLLALALACIGLYGVMTWSVLRRTSASESAWPSAQPVPTSSGWSSKSPSSCSSSASSSASLSASLPPVSSAPASLASALTIPPPSSSLPSPLARSSSPPPGSPPAKPHASIPWSPSATSDPGTNVD
ncbi:MAG: ABC transporter permease [Acidobacteriaceae bacterium]